MEGLALGWNPSGFMKFFGRGRVPPKAAQARDRLGGGGGRLAREVLQPTPGFQNERAQARWRGGKASRGMDFGIPSVTRGSDGCPLGKTCPRSGKGGPGASRATGPAASKSFCTPPQLPGVHRNSCAGACEGGVPCVACSSTESGGPVAIQSALEGQGDRDRLLVGRREPDRPRQARLSSGKGGVAVRRLRAAVFFFRAGGRQQADPVAGHEVTSMERLTDRLGGLSGVRDSRRQDGEEGSSTGARAKLA